MGPPHTVSSFDRSSAELGQLLSRLQQTVLHADPEREQRLRTSEFERARLSTVRKDILCLYGAWGLT